MKKLLCLIIWLLVCSPAWGASLIGSGTASGGASACNDISENEETSSGYWQEVGRDSTTEMYIAASKFTATSTFTLCDISLYIKAIGTPTHTYTAYIYSNDDKGNGVGSDDEPDSVITGDATSDTWDSTGKSTTFEWVDFEGVSATITSGTTYWVVLKSDGIDTSNYIGVRLGTDGVVEHLVKGTAAESWASEGAYTFIYRLYK